MNWYKIAQLETDWWVRFYDHLSNTADFILKDAGVIFDPRASSINDGRNVSFRFNSIFNNVNYACRIQLQFSEMVQGSTFGEMGTGTLKGVNNQPSQNLLRANVSVLTDSQIVGSQIFQSQNAVPATMMNFVRDSIIKHQEPQEELYNDGYDDHESGDNYI